MTERRTVVWMLLALGIGLFVAQAGLADSVEYQTAASADDTVAKSSSNYSTIAYLYLPDSDSGFCGFMRWAVNIPAGSTITSAYLQVRAYSTFTTSTTVRLQLLDSDSCADFSSNPYSMAVTASHVDWMAEAWTGGQWYESPDIKTIVQEFVDRAGYTSGNYLGLRGMQTSGSNYKRACSYDYSGHLYGPKLAITYTTNQPPVADGGSDQNVTDSDDNGYETVTLDGSGSSDSDGTITSWVWEEGGTPIATGETASVSLAVGTHTVTLVVTDDASATDDDMVEVVINEAPSETTVECQTAASEDDTYCSDTGNSVTNSTMNWVYPGTDRRAFVRWDLSDIPQGATIVSAYVKVKASAATANTTTGQLQLVDSDDCPSLAASNPYNWSVTGPTVDWAVPPMTADVWYTSPDVKTVVQGFIDRPGYAVGNYLGMRSAWVSGSTLKYAYQWNYGDHTHGPTLEVTYTGGNFVPVADAGDDQTVTDSDDNGYETVTLDGSESSDSGGTITSWVWKEGETQIATGETADVSLAVGSHTITLIVTDDDSATDSDEVVITVRGPKFYVDFDSGSDSNNGMSTGAAWQHCPGDPNATGVPGSFTLLPGDTVVFKGGVEYRGTVECSWSGSEGSPIIYDGNTADTWGTGKAVIDGSQPLTGWTQCTSAAEAGGNPNYANIWYAYAPAGTNANTSNLYQYNTNTQTDTLCWMAQAPNQPDPFFMDRVADFYTVPYEDVTATSVTDSTVLSQASADYWNGAYVMVWVVPNMVKARAITGFDPDTDTITFESVGTPNTGEDGTYAVYNHISLIDQAGEYYFNETAEGNGTHKVWLWPPVGNPNTYPVSVSVPSERTIAFTIPANSGYLTFDGLKIQKFSSLSDSSAFYTGGGISNTGTNGVSNVTIVNCDFTGLRHDFQFGNGYGAITLKGSDFVVRDNTLVELPVTNGMQFMPASDTVIEDNLIQKPGRMGLWALPLTDSQIIGNTVLEVRGTHANGITVFQGSDNVLIMGNTVLDSEYPLATQASSNLTVAYNYLQCSIEMYAYDDYGGCTNLKIHNNTLIRPDNRPSVRNDSNGELKNNIMYTWNNQGSSTPDANSNLWINHSMDTTVFADPTNDDYHLTSGSPAIDQGLDLGYDYDIDGTSVPQGDDPDIGAYEYTQ